MMHLEELVPALEGEDDNGFFLRYRSCPPLCDTNSGSGLGWGRSV
jgi:hypothetical protein